MSNTGPLSTAFNLSGVSTARPVIADGHLCHARFAGVKLLPTEKGNMMSWEFHLLDEAPTGELGKSVKPGFSLNERIYLYGKDVPPGEIPPRAIVNMCKIIDAILGTDNPENKKGRPVRPDFSTDSIEQTVAKMNEAMLAQEVWFIVKVKNDDKYGAQNDIAKFIFREDLKA